MNGLIAQPIEWESIEDTVKAAALMAFFVLVWAALAVAMVTRYHAP